MTSHVITLLTVAALLQSACSTTPEYQIAREKDVVVTVSVVDSAGKPIPYAEVWRVVSPSLQWRDRFDRIPRHELSPAYLNRVADRYGRQAEFAGPWRPGFRSALVSGILTRGQFARLVQTSESGETSEILKVESDRPALITVRYSALSHDYQPEVVERMVGRSDKKISLRIMLRGGADRGSDSAVERAFGRLRYEAEMGSDRWGGNERMEKLRAEMLALAAATERAGDKPAAARIYAWVPFIPTVLSFDNRSGDGVQIRGFTREDERSSRNLALLQKAYVLDPGNRYLRMKHLFFWPPAEAQDQIRQLEDLLAGGNDVWPDFHLLLEELYMRVGRTEDAKLMLRRYESIEPDEVQNWANYKKLRLTQYVTLQEFRDTYVIEGDVNKADVYLRNPMFYAVHAGRVDLFDWLLTQSIKTPLDSSIGFQALVSRNPAMVRRLLEADTAVVGSNALKQLRGRWDVLRGERSSPWADTEALDEIENLLRPRETQ